MLFKMVGLSFCFLGSISAPSLAQNSIPDGAYWSGGGFTVRVDVTDTTPEDPDSVDVNVVDASGFSSPVTGTQGNDTVGGRDTTTNAPPMTTRGGNRYKVAAGFLYYWDFNSETWKRCKKSKRPRFHSFTSPGILFFLNDTSDEVTSLPH